MHKTQMRLNHESHFYQYASNLNRDASSNKQAFRYQTAVPTQSDVPQSKPAQNGSVSVTAGKSQPRADNRTQSMEESEEKSKREGETA